jgi:hypothetical protein
MKCHECRNQFSAYLESALSQSLRGQVEEHLKTCGSCQEEWAGFEAMMADLGGLTPIHAPDGLEFSVLKRLRRMASAGPKAQWEQGRVLRYCLGSALCTLLVCLAVFWSFASTETGDLAALDSAQIEKLRTDGFVLLPDQEDTGENYVLIRVDEPAPQFDMPTMPNQGGDSLYRKLGLHDSIYLGGDEEMELYYLPAFQQEERADSRSNGRPELIPVASKIAF